MAPQNSAAYLVGAKVRPLQVKEAPYTPPKDNEIVIHNAAVAINPEDWLKQDMGDLVFGWMKYPIVSLQAPTKWV